MSASIHIEMDILFSMFCLLLFYQQKKHKVFDFLGTTTFNSLLWMSIGIMAVDIVSWMFMGNLLPHSDLDLMLVQTLYYLIQAILPLLFLTYCINTTGKVIRKSIKTLMHTPIAIAALILFVNTQTGYAFYVENNMIVRGPGFLFAIGTPMAYVSVALILCLVFYIRCRNDESEDKRRIAFHILMCVLICFIGALACAFVNYISPWFPFVSALVYLYIQLHGLRESSLDVLAFTDSLTGLKNHASFSMIKRKMEEKIAASPSPAFAIVMMDVNDLKKTNDLHGHQAGNALIIAAAKLMCRIFSHSPVCRIGGDEFVAILENNDFENREALYQQFTDEIHTATFSIDGKDLPLTVAIGMCEFDPTRHSSFDDTFQYADSMMYENKAILKAGKPQ